MKEHPSLFFEKTYRDASLLLYRTKEYIRFEAMHTIERTTPPESLKISAELLRVTARLTQIMTWLLAQKAAYGGEMSFEEACTPQYKLPHGSLWLENLPYEDLDKMPLTLITLLEESQRLYVRVTHLSDMSARYYLKPSGQNSYTEN